MFMSIHVGLCDVIQPKMVVPHYFLLSSLQTYVTLLLFIRVQSGLRQIAWFDKDLHFKFTCFQSPTS